MDLRFESLSPEQAASSNAKIIITTKDEAEIVRRKDVFLDTEVDRYPALLKAKILRNIMGSSHDDQLTIGIDPGTRIGISVMYFHNEIESTVESSLDSTIQLVSVLLSGIRSNKKIVRIGDGNIAMAKRIAWMTKARFKDLVNIEIANRRGARDRSSARNIALRRGRIFKSSSFDNIDSLFS
jgi:hypothetical protein